MTQASEDSVGGRAMPEIACADVWRQLEEDVGPEGARHITGIFMGDVRKRLDRMRAHLASGDRRSLLREAHTLKSSAASLGFEAMSHAAAELEAAVAKAGVAPAAGGDGQVLEGQALEGHGTDSAFGHLIAVLESSFQLVGPICQERLAAP